MPVKKRLAKGRSHRREYLDLSEGLHSGLGLKLWEMDVLSPLATVPTRPTLRTTYTETWERARELRLALDKAAGAVSEPV
jgi:hypothetical protein